MRPVIFDAGIAYNRFAELAEKMAGESRAIAEETAELVAEDMRSRVPVRLGLLRESIKVMRLAGVNGAVIGIGNKKAFYPHLIEWGTVKMAARPFIRPAVEAGREPYFEKMSELEERVK
jgi:HK97 gp10 family phage protein